jgi:hypothetical protein
MGTHVGAVIEAARALFKVRLYALLQNACENPIGNSTTDELVGLIRRS